MTPTLYHFYIFGTPSTSETWGWRVEGHHLSVSVTLVDGQTIAPTPAFFGANPANVKQGPQEGLRVLHAEEDLARELLQSSERRAARFGGRSPPRLRLTSLTVPGREAVALEPAGLPASQMTKDQRQTIVDTRFANTCSISARSWHEKT